MLRRWIGIAVLLLLVLPKSSGAAIITYFSFNGYDGDSATINADIGTGILTLEEEGAAWPAIELDVDTGTDINAVAPFPAGDALVLGHNNDETLVRSMTFQIDTTGFQDIMFSGAMSGSNATFDTGAISYSLDGVDFIDTALSVDPSATGTFELRTADLSGFPILNDQSTLFIRVELSGDNLNANQFIQFDNVLFEATVIPEPPAWAMMLVAGALVAAIARRRRNEGRVAADSPGG